MYAVYCLRFEDMKEEAELNGIIIILKKTNYIATVSAHA